MSRNYNRNNKKRYSRSNNRNSGGHSHNGNKTPDYNPMMFVRKAAPQDLETEYEAKNKFSNFNLNSILKRNILQKGYETPTPIQDQAIQPLLDGKDVIGIAATGTGKTAAFLIPLINKVLRSSNEKVLIVAPTRELAIQVEKELRWFVRGTNIRSAVCIGGVGMGQQINNLRSDPAFVVGTPGRLLDLGKQRKLNFSRFGNIVLDEVDRMLDMGFVKDITFLISQLSKNRQSLFFSATLPVSAEKIARQFLKDPVTITVKTQRPSENVDQDIVKINGQGKINVLVSLLNKQELKKVLVFGRTKRGIENLRKILDKNGISVTSIHGNKSQGQRKRALEEFRNNKVGVLLATDVASRGLDIDNITHVINYDLPQSYDDYIHRIGRTGRANQKGFALTFIE